MEIAIPLIALGGMYIISNHPVQNNNKNEYDKNRIQEGITQKSMINNSKSQKENFTNMGDNTKNTFVSDIKPQTYPVENMPGAISSVEDYANPNTATDKYFDQNHYQNQINDGNRVGNNPQQIYSLSGNYLNSDQFKHNNMVPFNGAKVKGYAYNTNIAETVLDNMVGSGSQVIKKIEQSPLFKPEENIQWSYGTPNQSDFFQSRINPGTKINNVKPFETINVGPGLNKGYGTSGSGGFNSGMEERDLWLPKTIDELRVATNPKLEYELTNHEGPANSYIKNSGIIGRVEKQRPDTFFINTQDRWLTTTGAEKGETQRPIQEMGNIKKNNSMTDYKGPAGSVNKNSGYAPSSFEPSKRVETMTCDVPLSSAIGKGPINDGDNYIKSHTNYTNNRSTIKQPDTLRSGFSGAIGAVIAPLMDILRPSRKEETINNVRVYGEAGSSVPQSYINNPNDVVNTTVKETTIYSSNFYINNQKEGTYINNYKPTDLTQRNETCSSYSGVAGGQSTQYGEMNYESAYNQHNNDIKSQSIYNRPNIGGTQMFNQQMNVSISKQDDDRYNSRMSAPSSVIKMPPTKENYGYVNTPQKYNEEFNCERISPDLLTAFKNNPYTHSLTTSV